jgi:hypothetical protein
MSMPPFYSFAIIQQIPFAFSLLKVRAIIIDHRCCPQHYLDSLAVEVVNQTLRVREKSLVPDKVIIAGGPARVYVKTTEGDFVFHVILGHLQDLTLILSVIEPYDM